MRLLVALTGPMGSGKTTVANALHDWFGFEVLSGSDVLRRANAALPPDVRMTLESREEYDRFQRAWKTVNGYGAIGRIAVEKLLAGGADAHVCYEGVRNEFDEAEVRKAGGIVIALACDEAARYKRVVERDPAHAPTLERFRADDELESNSKDPLGLHLTKLMKDADITVDASKGVREVVDDIVEALQRRGFSFV